jgi:hypothetical protein
VFGARLLSAALAGLLWYPLIMLGTSLGGELTPLPAIGSDTPPWRAFGWLVIWSTGSLYAAAVLLPLSRRPTWYRATLLLIAGAFSYWAAVQFAVESPGMHSGLVSVTIAGALSALFIGAVVVWHGDVPLEAWRWPALIVAGAVGGALIGAAVDYLDDAWTWAPGHVVWEMATCAALWFRRSPSAR